ncbi:MAG: molybdate ABC transporter substrate-binding protein [Rickettsiales bacterium]|nr:molybdate ABC transporter substrate-binding protein [Rickettsiales bacterium]
MKKISFILLIFFFFTQNSYANNSRNITIFAEQNMVPALTKIATIFSQKNNVIISVNFNSSLESINDIDMGEPANIFISGHIEMIETLKQKGLVDVYNVSYIARDKLKLVTSKNNKLVSDVFPKSKNINLKTALLILNNAKATIIIDHSDSTSGSYSEHLLSSLTLTDLNIAQKLLEDKTPITDIVKRSPESYALLLDSQIRNKKDLIVLATAEENNIFYQALVIAGDNMDVAREFLKFLKSKEAQNILQKNGFIIN